MVSFPYILPPLSFSERENYVLIETDQINAALPNPYLQPNLSARVQVKSGVLPIGAPFSLPFKVSDKRGVVDIQSAFTDLKPYLPPDVLLDPATDYELGEAGGALIPYTIEAAEKYGTPPIVQNTVTTAVAHMLAGWGKVADLRQNEFAYTLTNQPVFRKTIAPKQPEFLYIVPKQTFGLTIFVEIQLIFEDGTTLLNIPFDERKPMEQNKVVLFRTGFEANGLHLLNTGSKKIVAYDYRVLRDNTLLNEPTPSNTSLIAELHYQLDYAAYDSDIYLICENGYGALETIRLRGKIVDKATSEVQKIERKRWYGTTHRDGEAETIDDVPTQRYEVDSFLMRTHNMRYYRDILLRGQFWFVDVKTKRFVKAVRVTTDIELNPRIPFNNFKFSFDIAWND